VPYKIHELIS